MSTAMKLTFTLSLFTLSLCAFCQQAPPAGPAETELLARQYREGEKLSYHMKGTNEERGKTLAYEIQADGVVRKGLRASGDSAVRFPARRVTFSCFPRSHDESHPIP
jgi:hypothetical protein